MYEYQFNPNSVKIKTFSAYKKDGYTHNIDEEINDFLKDKTFIDIKVMNHNQEHSNGIYPSVYVVIYQETY